MFGTTLETKMKTLEASVKKRIHFGVRPKCPRCRAEGEAAKIGVKT